MKIIEYEKLLAEIALLDFSALSKLEADLARLVQRRQAEKSGKRRSIMELATMAGESLHDLEQESYWSEREKNLAESRASWVDRENEFERGHRS
jgi:hypothetical protein